MEILGDDEEDRSYADRPPFDPRATAWAPGTTAFRTVAPPDVNAPGHEPQAGRDDAAQRRTAPAAAWSEPLTGSAAPSLDLGEQARDPHWEQTWNTGPVPLSTVRVDPGEANQPGAGAPPDAQGATRRTRHTGPIGVVGAPGTPGPPGTDPAGHPVQAPPPAQPAPVLPLSPRDKVVGTVASPEALGVAGVMSAFGTAVSSLPMIFAFASPTQSPRSQLDAYAMTFAFGGVLAIALGIAACLRLRADGHPLTRGLAGASVILGLLLIVLAAFTSIHAGDMPTDFG
jgi:hypothetical protein